MPDKLSITWGKFQSNLSSTFSSLRSSQYFTDVTLVSDDLQQVEAHKLVLTACSGYFGSILKRSTHPHPLLCLEGVSSAQLSHILQYIYNGEIMLNQEDVEQFLTIAKRLRLQGLTSNDDQESKPHSETEEMTIRQEEYKNLQGNIDVCVDMEEEELLEEKLEAVGETDNPTQRELEERRPELSISKNRIIPNNLYLKHGIIQSYNDRSEMDEVDYGNDSDNIESDIHDITVEDASSRPHFANRPDLAEHFQDQSDEERKNIKEKDTCFINLLIAVRQKIEQDAKDFHRIKFSPIIEALVSQNKFYTYGWSSLKDKGHNMKRAVAKLISDRSIGKELSSDHISKFTKRICEEEIDLIIKAIEAIGGKIFNNCEAQAKGKVKVRSLYPNPYKLF